MALLQRLSELQLERGFLSEATLREFAKTANVPLHKVQQLVSFYPHFRTTPPPRVELLVCRDLSCLLNGAAACAAQLLPLNAGDVEVKEVSCIGRCDRAPAGMLNGNSVPLADVAAVRGWVADLDAAPHFDAGPVRAWRQDSHPTPADRYGTIRGLRAEADAGPRVIQSVKDAGLRGMGGAGFPTGTKWEFVRTQPAAPKYVICNADESEPGTFKDAAVLRDLPHLMLEGMMIAGLSVGAATGIVYLRHEYHVEELRLREVLTSAREQGLLGPHVGFDIELFISPGGYILGEETALLEALEDRRGEPRNKPPFPGSHGLYGKPTVINNVETFANIPGIVRNGADWWKALGTAGCGGPKLFAVSGHVERPGVYEVPLGTTVGALIELAGGVSGGRKLLAVMPGGASSNLLGPEALAVPLDFAALQKAGSMLGSGAVVVIAEGTDLLAVAANVTRFFRNESCGKCVPCRVGSEKAVAILDGVLDGTRDRKELAMLPDLGEAMALTSICGLGQVAVAPALSVLKRWPDAGRTT